MHCNSVDKILMRSDMNSSKVVQVDVIKNLGKILPKELALSYILVNKIFIHVGDILNFNLYHLDAMANMLLFLERNSMININIIEKLKEVNELYVHENEKNKYEFF